MKYRPIKNKPVAKFYYKGTHSHPVRRTIIITENKDKVITGYELREGSLVRSVKEAPIKSYKKSKITKYSQLGRANHKTPGKAKSTLKRLHLLELIEHGS